MIVRALSALLILPGLAALIAPPLLARLAQQFGENWQRYRIDEYRRWPRLKPWKAHP